MRKLVLKREKVFVACLGKIRIFVEDGQGSFSLGGISCRQLGVLKNGQTGEYEIPGESVKVFVVFSKVAPQKYYSYYQLPAGEETVELFTGPELNPGEGNPFKIFSKEDLINLGITGGW